MPIFGIIHQCIKTENWIDYPCKFTFEDKILRILLTNRKPYWRNQIKCMKCGTRSGLVGRYWSSFIKVTRPVNTFMKIFRDVESFNFKTKGGKISLPTNSLTQVLSKNHNIFNHFLVKSRSSDADMIVVGWGFSFVCDRLSLLFNKDLPGQCILLYLTYDM